MNKKDSLKCLTSPDPKKAAACRKWHAWADHLASPHGRTKKIEIEKSKEKNRIKENRAVYTEKERPTPRQINSKLQNEKSMFQSQNIPPTIPNQSAQ